jgi:membrane protein
MVKRGPEALKRWTAARVAGASAGVRSAVSSITSRLTAVPPPRPAPPVLPQYEVGRTHVAEKPYHLPLRGWGEVALIIWDKIATNRLFLVAAGVAFYVMLSLFPAISALVWVFGLFADPAVIAGHLNEIAFLLPKEALTIISSQVNSIAGGKSQLTPLVALTILIAFWSANAGMKAMIDAMNLIYDTDEKRSFVVLNFHSMLFTLGALGIFLATLGLLVVIPLILAFVDLGGYFNQLFFYARWPSLLVVTIIFLTFLNRYGPSRHYTKSRWPVWGSTLGAIMWLGVSLGFSFYVERIGNLAATYGSLAAIIGLMLWLWLSALVVLIGTELTAELERRTLRWEADMAALAEAEARTRTQSPLPGGKGALARMAAFLNSKFRG